MKIRSIPRNFVGLPHAFEFSADSGTPAEDMIRQAIAWA